MTQDERKGLILCLKIEFSDGLGGDLYLTALIFDVYSVLVKNEKYSIGKSAVNIAVRRSRQSGVAPE